VNTFQPERLARLRRLLILGDKGDPVMPVSACRYFAKHTGDATVIMAYNERRHHTMGKDALQKYAVPFVQNRQVSVPERRRRLFSLLRRVFRSRWCVQ
jgi:hypothetical protein